MRNASRRTTAAPLVRLRLSCLLLACSGPAMAGPSPPVLDSETSSALAWQIALESWGFSPGLIDGVLGPKTRLAIAAAQSAQALPATGNPDTQTTRSLGVSEEAIVTQYTITEADLTRVAELPSSWEGKSRVAVLSYPSVAELVQEKFHTTRSLLERLNPGVSLARLAAGDQVNVPASVGFVHRRGIAPSLVEIDLERKVVLALREDAQGRRYLVGLLHCSISSNLRSAPVGECRITSNVHDPEYTFDPAQWPEVKDVSRKLTIPGGPRNPVGVRWIGLDRPGIGIHGTPNPENIGRTGSHGCFRLTNWDAEWLSSVVQAGLPVHICERAEGTSWSWNR